MESKYVVEVREPPGVNRPQVIKQLAESFGVDQKKAQSLLRRVPGPVTKAVSEQEAKKVARLFKRAGLQASMRPASEEQSAQPSKASNPDKRLSSTAVRPPKVEKPAPQRIDAHEQEALEPGEKTVVSDNDAALQSALNKSRQSPPRPPSATRPPPPPRPAAQRPPPSPPSNAAPTRSSKVAPEPKTPEQLQRRHSTKTPSPEVFQTQVVNSGQQGPAHAGLMVPPESGAGDANTLDAMELQTSSATAAKPSASVWKKPAWLRVPHWQLGFVSLRSKFVLASITPALLVLLAALIAVLSTVPGALRLQLLESARNPAIAFASSIAGLIDTERLAEPAVQTRLQAMLESSRSNFQRQNVLFILVTDADGNRIAGWYGDGFNSASIPAVVSTAIQTQARRAAARAFIEQAGIALGSHNPPSRLIDIGNSRIEVASHAISRGERSLGAVVIGISDAVIAAREREVLLSTSTFGAIPVLLAVVLAVILASALTRNIIYLIRSADQISRGNLSQQVSLQTNDELGELSKAIERMRISLQEGLERLRRRRR